MKIVFYLSIPILAIIFLSNSALSQEKIYTISETNITLSNGEGFTISLDANHTTGYSWTAVVSDTTILMIESNSYVTPETHIMGKGGQEGWHFRGVMKGSVTVTFSYSRPWDKDTPPAKTATFNVTVQ